MEIYQQRALFRGCDGCVHQGECDDPVEPCPPIAPKDGSPDTKMISPINPDVWKWIRSVNGLDLDIPWPSAETPQFPPLIPTVKRKLSGPEPAQVTWVGITLSKILTVGGRLRYRSREEFFQDYNISPTTKLVLVMIEKDQPLENFWLHHSAETYKELAAFGFAAAIAPNFSVFQRRSPLEHRVNYKRSLIVATDLAQVGIPTVPHVYASGPKAVTRWVKYLRDNPSITTIAREVQTTRSNYTFFKSIDYTNAIVSQLGRPIHIVVVGTFAKRRLQYLSQELADFSVFSASMNLKAASRRIWRPGTKWLKEEHECDAVPTDTFENNIQLGNHYLARVIAEAQTPKEEEPAVPPNSHSDRAVPSQPRARVVRGLDESA